MFLKLMYFKRTIYNIPLSIKDYIKVLYFTLFNFKKTLYNKPPYFKDYIKVRYSSAPIKNVFRTQPGSKGRLLSASEHLFHGSLDESRDAFAADLAYFRMHRPVAMGSVTQHKVALSIH